MTNLHGLAAITFRTQFKLGGMTMEFIWTTSGSLISRDNLWRLP